MAENLVLSYNYDEGRYGVWDNEACDWHIPGLHCGECLNVLFNGRWMPTRIEMSDDWYLVGLDKDLEMRGLSVHI